MAEKLGNYEDGLAALEGGDYPEALKHFVVAASKDSIDANIQYALGFTHLCLGSYDAAARALMRSLKIQPDHSAALASLAEVRMEQGKYGIAARAFTEYLAGEDVPYHLNKLAATYARMGNHDLAVTIYRTSMILEPQNATAYNNCAISLNKIGKHEEAAATCRSGLKIAPRDCDLTINLACSLRLSGRLKTALRVMMESDESCRHTYAGALEIGNTYADLKMYNEAVYNFNQAKQINPESPDAYDNLGITYDQMGRYEDAEREYRRALELDPSDAAVHNNLAANLELQGDSEGARFEFSRAVQLEPRNEFFRKNLESVS